MRKGVVMKMVIIMLCKLNLVKWKYVKVRVICVKKVIYVYILGIGFLFI